MYFTSFFPEAIVDTNWNWQVFWLAFFLRPSHPEYSGQWQEFQKVCKKGLQLRVQLPSFTGFPIIPSWRKPTLEPFPGTKVRIKLNWEVNFTPEFRVISEGRTTKFPF